MQGSSLIGIQSFEPGTVLWKLWRSIILPKYGILSRLVFVLCEANLPSLVAVGCITVPWYGLRQPCRLKVGNWTRCSGTVAAIFPCTASHLSSSSYSTHLLSLVVTDCGNRAGLQVASRRDRGELQARLPPSYPCALLQTALECGLASSKLHSVTMPINSAFFLHNSLLHPVSGLFAAELSHMGSVL